MIEAGRVLDVEVLRIPRAIDVVMDRCAAPVRRRRPVTLVVPVEERWAVAWSRWVVGHQVLFLLWRLLGESLRCALGRAPRGPALTISIQELIDLCSVLFLYCGSCPTGIYLRVLRPAMARQHPALSGEWATDYREIPGLVQGFVRAGSGSAAARATRDAWLLHHRIHAAVATRLVPGQPSLLQHSGRTPGTGPSAVEADLYDSFFRTRRDPLCVRGFLTQARQWLVKTRTDLTCFGLNYDSSPLSADMDGGDGRRVAELERQAVAMLAAQIGRLDACLGDDHE